MHHSRKPHPCIFIQNSITKKAVDSSNEEVWIENSYISEGWSISQKNIITGVPKNNWNITLAPGQCIDIVPMGETQYVVRPYGFNDRFAGEEQQRPQFPIVDNIDEAGLVLRYMLNQETEGEDKGKGKAIFEKHKRLVLSRYLLLPTYVAYLNKEESSESTTGQPLPTTMSIACSISSTSTMQLRSLRLMA